MQHVKNVDSEEIAKFEAHANEWWNLNGEYKTLHGINPLRLQFIQQHVDLTSKNVLDVGCGGGILTESLAQQGARVTGIDMGKASLAAAQEHLSVSHLSIDYQLTTVEALANEKPQSFDVVTCMEMLEHVPDPVSVINACAKLVKPEGYLFFSTLNRHPKSYLFAILGAEYFLQLLPKGTHDYAKFIRPSELERTCREAGICMKTIKGMGYNPLTKNYFLTKDVSVNYLVYCQKK